MYLAMAPSSSGRGTILSLSLLAYLLIIILSASPSSALQRERSSSSGLSWRTARSHANSLLLRITNHRLAKGDTLGAERISNIRSSLDRGFSFWKNASCWEYLINYSWRRMNRPQVLDILRHIGDIQSAMEIFLKLPSDMDRLQWISANYNRILQIAQASLPKLLSLLNQPGALPNFAVSLQTEIVTGDILRDILELGAADLQSLVQLAKEMLQIQYEPSSAQSSSEL